MSEPLGIAPLQVHVVDDRWAQIRQAVETIAILAAGFWAFYTFVYQEKIKPASEPAALDTSIAIHRLGRDARRDILGITSTLRNSGRTEIEIAADGYVVDGVRYATHAVKATSHSEGQAASTNDIPVTSTTNVHSFMELRRATEGALVDRDIIMEPGTSFSLTYTVVIPRGEYDALKAYVIAFPVKTPVTKKLRIRITHNSNGQLWLHGDGSDAIDEDDNATEFALVP